MSTWQLAIVIWIITGTTLAGIGILIVVATPQLDVNAMRLVPIAAIAGFVVALLPSYMIAVNIKNPKQV